VGWRNDTVGMAGHPVEIVFEFDRVRNFSAMYLHTNNLFSKDVQVSDAFSTGKYVQVTDSVIYWKIRSGE
jgi:hypothetical protein